MASTLKGPARRTAALVAALIMVVLMPAGARADSASSSFQYGPDSANWYWRDQMEKTVGAGPVAQVVTLGNPQAPDTLPVAAQNGQADKISAIQFDLLRRGVKAGSAVAKFAFTIAESDEVVPHSEDASQPDAQPSFNTDGKVIQACPITGVWSTGDGAELWERAPSYDTTACARGKRIEADGSVAWTFDVTKLAKAWALDPTKNSGVMLVPVTSKDAAASESTWQINLKLPRRDDDSTSGTDEYEQTKDRVRLNIAYTAPAAPSVSGTNVSGGGTNFTPTGTSTGTPSDFPFGTTAPVSGGSSTTPVDSGPQTRTSSPTASRTVPRLPWYVWVLIPLGLMAISTVRAVVLEPLATGKPGGVIVAIRTRNAELRGIGTGGGAFGRAASRGVGRLSGVMSVGFLGRRAWERVASLAARSRRALRQR